LQLLINYPYVMDTINRKDFFKKMGALGVAAFSASALVSACSGSESGKTASNDTPAPPAPAAPEAPAKATADDPCSDLTGLSEADIKGREALGYIAESNVDGQVCTNCNFWQEPAEGSPCGGCQLMKGPIHPDGWCKSWFAKKA
jgi:hypothetical protein